MFVRGKSYSRREIHSQLGGQAQGGISTPVDHALILVFTGEQGEQYGYRDGWTEDGVFLYTGEGQRGDMEFVRGNRAIRDHLTVGKDLHLFEYVERGLVRYVGQMIFAGFQRREAPDLDGKMRSAIVFQLLPLDSFHEMVRVQDGIDDQFARLSMGELRRRAIEEAHEPSLPRESKQAAYSRSAAVRIYILGRAAGTCEACEKPAPFLTPAGQPYLEPHHIRRLSDGGPDHPEWVAGVCPNCHCRAHYSDDKEDFNARLRAAVLDKEHRMQMDA
jgi:5-methylcytosine-specific restriction enzyme A